MNREGRFKLACIGQGSHSQRRCIITCFALQALQVLRTTTCASVCIQ